MLLPPKSARGFQIKTESDLDNLPGSVNDD